MKTLVGGAPGEVVTTLTDICEKNGYPFTQVAEMADVARYVEEGEHVDVICLAHYLTDGTSFEACKLFRNSPRWRHSPIVLVMERPMRAVIEKAFASGFSETFNLSQSEELKNFLSFFESSRTRQQGRVLVVEDSVTQQHLVTTILAESGLESCCCLDANSAEDLVLRQDFDLIITDIVLEGSKTGLELISSVRKMPEGKGDIPIIVMSSYKDVSQKLGPFRIGADDYISKPLDAEELLARTNRLLKARKLMLKVKEQQYKLEETNKFMSQMLGRVSHECRNSINIVMGISKMMLKREKMTEGQKNKVETIVNASKHQLSLLDDILDYTKLDSGNIELNLTETDLLNLVDEVVSLFRYKCEEQNLALQVDVGEGLPNTAMIDERLVKQVLINLLNNAVKFTQDGFIRVGVTLDCNRQQLVFDVVDSGPGIPEGEMALLFEAFKQTTVGKGVKSSTGLGLSLCQGFANVMGGRIEVDSTLGHGSTFRLIVPHQ